ncbi:MAG: class I SAM-dependent rRNA methyltransferase [Gammaproteobacteria bacterium]|jgi:23S rRNA (cytosine1962-C5)-methyltransferase
MSLVLRKNEERRLRAGHLWVFSNEVDVRRSPLTGFEPGQLVQLQAHNGRPIGTAYVNPHSLIAARLLSRGPQPFNWERWLTTRLRQALALRERLFAQPFYRLVFGESDGLPGLVVDRYRDYLVVQITTAGMEVRRDSVIEALDGLLHPAGILLRNDLAIRELEGLAGYVETASGEIPGDVEVIEHDLRFRIGLLEGQKTGWFYDQTENRGRFGRHVKGARVLDVFSYVGAWGLRAAACGAAEVLCVDSSAQALQRAQSNAAANGLDIATLVADAADALKRLHEEGRRFDVVVVDPPAFIKRRRDVKKGLAAYHHLNQLAMQVLAPDGLLVSCSCSSHLSGDQLRDLLLKNARHLDRRAQMLEYGLQGPDHPMHPAIPETTYLKAWFMRLLAP